MNTFPIANTDDLLRALDQDVEIRNSVRRHLLTEELLNLPNRFVRFQARQDTVNERQEVFNSQQKAMNLRIESALEKLAEQTRRNGEDIKALTQSIKDLTRETRRNGDHIGELKGNLARYALNWHFDEIAENMGFSYRDTITRKALRLLVRQDGATIPLGVRQSFYRADLVMEVADSKGEIHYIAVEASYTADQRDTDRALRNAELLARFTGQPAHAAIASLRNDHAIQRLIDDKAVFWYQLQANDFNPE